jgi:hypothetical protein
MAMFANGIANRLGVPTVREVGDPAAAAALFAGSGKGGSFRSDLLHAIMDRLSVISDWFCHLRALVHSTDEERDGPQTQSVMR